MAVEEKKSFFGLGAVRSVAISLRHIFEKKITVQYPDQAPGMGFRFRGRHIFHQDVCIGCTQCERVCPVIAIKMETHKDPTSRKVVTDRFALDLGICYYCGLCEEVCPTDPKSIHLGPDFELATDALIGGLLARHLAGVEMPEDWAEQAVRGLWRGLAAEPGEAAGG